MNETYLLHENYSVYFLRYLRISYSSELQMTEKRVIFGTN